MDIQPIDLGWAAGFLEGEGYFSKGKSCISVQASQVQLEPLTKMQKLFGGSIHKYSQKNRPNCNDFYKWGVHGETAEAVMKLLFPLVITLAIIISLNSSLFILATFLLFKT